MIDLFSIDEFDELFNVIVTIHKQQLDDRRRRYWTCVLLSFVMRERDVGLQEACSYIQKRFGPCVAAAAKVDGEAP
jgi:hypothetical protein